jgi:hypothetical protein
MNRMDPHNHNPEEILTSEELTVSLKVLVRIIIDFARKDQGNHQTESY